MMVFVLWRNLMKLIYVSLVCILVTINSVFAMLCDKEGPSGEYNRYFFSKEGNSDKSSWVGETSSSVWYGSTC